MRDTELRSTYPIKKNTIFILYNHKNEKGRT